MNDTGFASPVKSTAARPTLVFGADTTGLNKTVVTMVPGDLYLTCNIEDQEDSDNKMKKKRQNAASNLDHPHPLNATAAPGHHELGPPFLCSTRQSMETTGL